MQILSTFSLSAILVGLILISAFFSGTETSITAINRYRLKTLVAKNNPQAKRLERLLTNIDNLIGVILLGNNFVNILAASITTVLTIRLWGEDAIIYASIVLTFIILIFAETTPKIFAAKNPEKVALPAAFIVEILIKIFKPFVQVISYLAKIILKLLRVNNHNNVKTISSEELRMVVHSATPVIASNYQKILLNIIDLEKVKVEDIMISRNNLISVNINNETETLNQLKNAEYTHLFTFENLQDNITGVLHMRDIAKLYARGEFSIEAMTKIIQKPYFIPESTNLFHQLEHFKTQKKRLGLVVDEYGEVIGMITMEDILAEIVGKFNPNQKDIMSGISKQKDGSYLLDPQTNIRELNALLKINLPVTKAKTLNGLILEELQNIPERDVSLKINNTLIDIIKISEQTIKLVRLKKL